MFTNLKDSKQYLGKYKGVEVWACGSMIGNNWYGDYYCTREKNGRHYKVNDSVCRSIEAVKDYINRHIDELKPQ